MLQSSSGTMVTPEGNHLCSPEGRVDVARGPRRGLSPRGGVVSPVLPLRQSPPSRGTRQDQGGVRTLSRQVVTCAHALCPPS